MINVAVHSHIMTISITRPEKKNALSPDMYRQMATAIENAPAQDAKAILIQGSEGCFTAGNDIADFASIDEVPDVRDTHRFMLALLECPLPVVAKVQGLAIGIGTTLLLHCDFVYCDESAKFAMPFINLGLVPEYASSYVLPRISGRLAAAELLMLGETFSAQTAFRCGMVTQVIESQSLDNKVQETLHKLIAKPAWALQQTKALLLNQKTELKAHMYTELEVFVKALNSAPAKEAFAAFAEKRPLNPAIFK